uniref:Uncharacterized protein n=1 Tax=Spongospora subterranea TaxID=70186 RepID=A0A0H5R589_9EUKA|eukprot:CRZ08967.1 hypothetical protein [Spongospora subterranea]
MTTTAGPVNPTYDSGNVAPPVSSLMLTDSTRQLLSCGLFRDNLAVRSFENITSLTFERRKSKTCSSGIVFNCLSSSAPSVLHQGDVAFHLCYVECGAFSKRRFRKGIRFSPL